MMAQTIRTMLCALGLLSVLIACSDYRTAPPPAANDPAPSRGKPPVSIGLVPQAKPPIPDLPLPVGFTLDESVSRNYESAGARLIDHTYEGKADKFEVERFYRHYMPARGWILRSSRMVRGTFVLSFEKDGEDSEILIDTTSKGLQGTYARVTIHVQTVGRGEHPAYQSHKP